MKGINKNGVQYLQDELTRTQSMIKHKYAFPKFFVIVTLLWMIPIKLKQYFFEKKAKKISYLWIHFMSHERVFDVGRWSFFINKQFHVILCKNHYKELAVYEFIKKVNLYLRSKWFFNQLLRPCIVCLKIVNKK